MKLSEQGKIYQQRIVKRNNMQVVDITEEVAQLEDALETIKNYANGACVGIDFEGEGFKGQGTTLFMIEEAAIQALKTVD